MKTSTRFNLLSFSTLVSLADALVQLEFSRQTGSLAKLASRDSTSAPISQGGIAWVVNATVGTPGQPLSLLISPSAPDTWVPDATSSYCDDSYFTSLYGDDYGDLDEYMTYCKWGSCQFLTL